MESQTRRACRISGLGLGFLVLGFGQLDLGFRALGFRV